MGIVIPNSPPVIRDFLQYGDVDRAYNPATDQQLRENRQY